MRKIEIKWRKPFADFLRERRESLRLSQTEVAAFLGCKPQFVSNWERGMSQPPNHMLRGLCKIYGVPEKTMAGLALGFHTSKLIHDLRIK